MNQLARRYTWWPNVNTDIEVLVKTCESCRIVATDPAKTYQDWPKPEKSWERSHLDYAGPFKGLKWLVCFDAHSKFPYVGMLEQGHTTHKTLFLF
jgi:hypothetical protein